MTKTLIKTNKELFIWKKNIKKNINFVPTMGNLHNGHRKLIETAHNYSSNKTILSIFINPLQFDNIKDFENYPKSIKKDIDFAFNSGADAIYIPQNKEIFPRFLPDHL